MLTRPVDPRSHRRLLAPRDERGSMIVAMSVIMILGMLSLAAVTRSMSNASNVRHTQDYSAALGAADSGLSDALYKIDQAPGGTFTGNGTAGLGTYSYTATLSPLDDNLWTVQSTGVVNKIRHAIEATVSRESEYPYAIFTVQDLTFHGNGLDNIESYNSLTGATNTHHAFVGSNHAITVRGAAGGGDEQDFYTPNGSCSGCPHPQQRNGPRVVADPLQPTTNTQPCPAGGTFNGVVDGQSGNTFVCNQNVTFGTVTVINPPVKVFVGNGYSIDMTNALINTGPGTHATDFQLLKSGTGNWIGFNGTHSPTINGIIYAPSSTMVVNGGQMTLDGSMTLNQLTINGNPNFSVAYDDAVSTITTTQWTVTDWHEVPA